MSIWSVTAGSKVLPTLARYQPTTHDTQTAALPCSSGYRMCHRWWYKNSKNATYFAYSGLPGGRYCPWVTFFKVLV